MSASLDHGADHGTIQNWHTDTNIDIQLNDWVWYPSMKCPAIAWYTYVSFIRLFNRYNLSYNQHSLSQKPLYFRNISHNHWTSTIKLKKLSVRCNNLCYKKWNKIYMPYIRCTLYICYREFGTQNPFSITKPSLCSKLP